MAEWRVIPAPTQPDGFAAALVVPLVNGDARVERVHPIPFVTEREAERAVARLNAASDKGGNDT